MAESSREPQLTFRLASRSDLAAIRALLADDPLGQTREDTSAEATPRYAAAFDAIDADPRNELWLACLSERVVGTYQITYIPYLSRGGNERCHIEAVRVASDLRGRGIGAAMMRFALDRARERGCLLAQLTTDKTRDAAHRFYLRLGFQASHEGMKLDLSQYDGSS